MGSEMCIRDRSGSVMHVPWWEQSFRQYGSVHAPPRQFVLHRQCPSIAEHLPCEPKLPTLSFPHPNWQKQSSRPQSGTLAFTSRTQRQSPNSTSPPPPLTTPAAASLPACSSEATHAPRPSVQLRHAQSSPTYHGAHWQSGFPITCAARGGKGDRSQAGPGSHGGITWRVLGQAGEVWRGG